MKRKIMVLMGFMTLLLAICTSLPVLAEQFQPTLSFHGSIDLTADTYAGYYPNDPDVVIPDGVTGEELERWEAIQKEDQDIKRIFKLTNPTLMRFYQNISLDFYANPAPDLEVNLKTSHGGTWGGQGTSDSLNFPLLMEEAYAQYYTDNAMYTIGRYKTDLGIHKLLYGNLMTGQEGLMVNTIYKDVWMTGLYNILLISMYKDYPYVSTFLFDDLAAFRFSTKSGNNLFGLNIMPNGFYDERGFSVDFNGKIKGIPTKAEMAFLYPAWVHRKDVGDQVFPALLVEVSPLRTEKESLDIRFGGMGVGFIPQYGSRGASEAESAVKINPNTAGIDILYQYGLSDDTILMLDFVTKRYIDKAYQEKVAKARYPLTTIEVKARKYLSNASNVSFGVSYNEDQTFKYTKGIFNWNFTF